MVKHTVPEFTHRQFGAVKHTVPEFTHRQFGGKADSATTDGFLEAVVEHVRRSSLWEWVHLDFQRTCACERQSGNGELQETYVVDQSFSMYVFCSNSQ